MQVVPMVVCNDSINAQNVLISHVKAERGNIYWYGDTEVVGIYLRLDGLLSCIADSLDCAGREYQK